MSGKGGSKSKTYIFTSAQACYYINKDGDSMPWGGGKGKAIPHYNLLKGFETLAKEKDAELVILPIAGKRSNEDTLHEDLEGREDIFRGTMLRLNKNLQLRDIVVPPQNVDPASGKEELIGKYGSSIIFAHSKQRIFPGAIFSADLPRYLYTTGAVTLPNYNLANHKGDTAMRNHAFGGLVVEVIDEVYYNLRNVRALQNGKFIDLGMEYNGDSIPERRAVDSLILGDIHWGDHDEATIKANYEMIEYFKPRRIFLHDFFNGHSINRHEKENRLRRAREFKRGRLNLEDELEADYHELVRLSNEAGNKCEIIIVASNHHAFLPTYINDTERWAERDLWNAEIGSYLFAKGVGLNIPEEEIDDAAYLIGEGLKRHGSIPENITFLRLKDSYKRHGYQLGSHGDKGASGARGGKAKARSKTGGGRSVTAHSHCMEVYGDTYIVGTSSKLDLPYTAGYGNANIAANSVMYTNGTIQMLPIIEGQWRK